MMENEREKSLGAEVPERSSSAWKFRISLNLFLDAHNRRAKHPEPAFFHFTPPPTDERLPFCTSFSTISSSCSTSTHKMLFSPGLMNPLHRPRSAYRLANKINKSRPFSMIFCGSLTMRSLAFLPNPTPWCGSSCCASAHLKCKPSL